jgi:uncharacterized protein
VTAVSTAQVPTGSASRYLQQVCKHWAHNLTVEFDAAKGTIVFPRDGRGGPWAGDGLVTLTAHPDLLECRIEASEPAHLAGLKGALARHIDRFAFREAPLTYDWHDGE